MSTPTTAAQARPKPQLSQLVDVTATLATHAEEHDRTADLPVKGLAVVHEAGLLTLTVATEHGGTGGGLHDTVRTGTTRSNATRATCSAGASTPPQDDAVLGAAGRSILEIETP
jgi:hypothetical protein